MSGARALVAYFSRRGENYGRGGMADLAVGNTEVVARMIAEATGADLLEIRTVRAYPAGYRDTTDVAKRELLDRARPLLDGMPEDLDGYGTIFVGYPNWWGTAPMAVFTFLESYDLDGVTVLPFCTHEGSGMGRSERDVRVAAARATLLPGLALRGSAVDGAGDDVRRWIDAVGLDLGSGNPTKET